MKGWDLSNSKYVNIDFLTNWSGISAVRIWCNRAATPYDETTNKCMKRTREGTVSAPGGGSNRLLKTRQTVLDSGWIWKLFSMSLERSCLICLSLNHFISNLWNSEQVESHAPSPNSSVRGIGQLWEDKDMDHRWISVSMFYSFILTCFLPVSWFSSLLPYLWPDCDPWPQLAVPH